MKDLPEYIFQLLKDQQVVTRGNLYLIGVSGGADSVALLDILNQIQHKLGIRLAVVHFNHQLRLGANYDEDFIRKYCFKLNISFYVKRRILTKYEKKISENKARILRYAFFKQMVSRLGASGVFLAHQQNDVAETVLMKLIRGAGLLGLRGILPVSCINDVLYLRPFLDISKSQIIDYLKRKQILFCVDETNFNDDFLRNKVRLKLLPLLVKEYNPDINNTLLDLSKISIEDYDFINQKAEVLFKGIAKRTTNTIILNMIKFKSIHKSIQRIILRKSFELLAGNLKQLTFKHIQLFEIFLNENKSVSLINWPQNIQIKINSRAIILMKIDNK